MTNDAGHDPVYEAELNEKMDVVEWILGNCGGVEEGVGAKEEREISGESRVQESIEKLDIYNGDSRRETNS